MKKHRVTLLFIPFMCTLLLIGCAAHKPRSPFQAQDLTPRLRHAAQKVDSFLVVFDASSSMNASYQGATKLGLAKDVVSRMNQTIPALKLAAGLRTFGKSFCPFSRKTTLVYGMSDYSQAELEQALGDIRWASGKSPLDLAIERAAQDLESIQGNTALIIVSDGDDMDDSPVAAAQAMKQAFGNRLCIYPILVGDDPEGKALMDRLARAGGCGFSTSAEAILSSQAMADYVERVFLGAAADSDGDGVADAMDRCPNTPRGVAVDSKGCPLDSDGDGVYDDKDRCPGTPKGVAVDRYGCPLDSDGDGVADHVDRCPDTPRGAPVDAKGCPLDTDGDGVYDYLDECPGTPRGAQVNEKGCWVLGGARLDAANVLFDTGKWDIKPQAFSGLDRVVAILKEDPTLRVEIQGHTDNVGARAYNQRLSENRAKAVMAYLVEKGIAADRLSAVGYGFSRPTATNDTPQGRAQNRRVELKPLR